MDQTLSVGMAVAITFCALLSRAIGPARVQIIRRKTRFHSLPVTRTRLDLAVAPFPAHKSV